MKNVKVVASEQKKKTTSGIHNISCIGIAELCMLASIVVVFLTLGSSGLSFLFLTEYLFRIAVMTNLYVGLFFLLCFVFKKRDKAVFEEGLFCVFCGMVFGVMLEVFQSIFILW